MMYLHNDNELFKEAVYSTAVLQKKFIKMIIQL